MRKLIRMIGLIFLSWAFTWSVASVPSAASRPSSPSDQAQVLGDARLSLIQGDVAIQTRDTGNEWGAASINTPIPPGTKVWVPENGRTEIQFLGGSYLRVAENTEADITNLNMDSRGSIIQVGVPQGRTYIYYAGSPEENSVFQVDTPVASARAYGASRFKVDVYEDGYTEVSVMSGGVYIEGQNGNTKIDPGSMLSIGTDQNAELSPMRQADGWDRWNQSRDSALARGGPSRRYLPATLDVYGNDFDTYGRWVSTPDYGYVWTPTVVVAGWAPYRLGRWCWIGADYVWISYEPWGWAPYHYGRWAFLAKVGWCWVPPLATAVYWGPGFVAWINTPTYVSWVPLAPTEIYYGHGYYGPHSVNITNVNINRINITNVYMNAKVVNAVTVVNRQTFLTGRAERVVDAPRNPFTAGVKPSIGRPDIKPERATAFPNPVKVVAEKKLPSREIITRAEKITNRPVASHRDISVFKPGERVKSMRVNRIERPKPITSVQKPGPGKPPVQRGEAGKTPSERREVVPPTEQRGQRGGPSTQREFGIAPPHKEERSAPSGRREQMGPPPERREVSPPPAQREDKGGPPIQREFGVAPSHKGEPKSSPPARREQMNKSSAPSTATPQTQQPQSVAPKREQMSSPPQRKEVAPPREEKGRPSGPSTHREFGIAPQHPGQSGTPPAQKKELGPSGQTSRPTPPAIRREPGPPAQMTKPVPPAPKGPTGGPSVQRNMGVAPPHVGKPSAPPAQNRPQGTPPGAPHTDPRDKDKR